MELEQIYQTGRDGLMAFSVLTNPKYQVNWHHKVIAHELEEVERRVREGHDKQTFVLLEVPPRHGKSEEASINFPAWFLGKNPDKEIITSSYSGELATDFGSKTRNLILSSEYRAIFNTKLRDDSQSKAKWVTEEGGSYTSVGVGGALTGRGANILLVDDPIKSREEADSETMRKKIWEWFRSTAYTRLEPNGVVIVIMQRWHNYDLIGLIKEEFKNNEHIDLRIIRFPAIAEEDEEYRKTGEPLWPERFDTNALMRIKQVLGDINWASQYQQRPILAERMEFKEEYFKYFEEEDIEDKEFNYTVTVDLATGDKAVKNGDDVAIVTVGKETDKPNWYVVDVTGGILDPLQTCDALFKIYEQYRPSRIAIESNSYQRTFKFWLDQEMKKRETYLPIFTFVSSSKKEERIRGLIPLFKTGVIKTRKNQLKLHSELLNFPMGQHDDYADALAMQLQVVSPQKKSTQDEELAIQSYLNSLEPEKSPYGEYDKSVNAYLQSL